MFFAENLAIVADRVHVCTIGGALQRCNKKNDCGPLISKEWAFFSSSFSLENSLDQVLRTYFSCKSNDYFVASLRGTAAMRLSSFAPFQSCRWIRPKFTFTYGGSVTTNFEVNFQFSQDVDVIEL